MQIKEYNTYYCKKDFYYNTKIIFEKGKEYLGHDESSGGSTWIIYNHNGGVDSTGHRFWEYNISDNFCNLKEIRKLKLEKLNENRR